MKDPVEVQLPASDRFFIVHVDKSRDRIPFTPLDNFPLDLGHSPVIESVVSKSLGVCIAGSTHVVRCSIASRTDRLS